MFRMLVTLPYRFKLTPFVFGTLFLQQNFAHILACQRVSADVARLIITEVTFPIDVKRLIFLQRVCAKNDNLLIKYFND